MKLYQFGIITWGKLVIYFLLNNFNNFYNKPGGG